MFHSPVSLRKGLGGCLLPFLPWLAASLEVINGLLDAPKSPAAPLFCRPVTPPVPGAQLVEAFLGIPYDTELGTPALSGSLFFPPVLTGDMLNESGRKDTPSNPSSRLL